MNLSKYRGVKLQTEEIWEGGPVKGAHAVVLADQSCSNAKHINVIPLALVLFQSEPSH